MSERPERSPLGDGLICRTLGEQTPDPDAESTSVYEPTERHGAGVPLFAAPPLGLDGRCFSRLAPLAATRRSVFWNFPNRLPRSGGPETLGRLLVEHADRAGLAQDRIIAMGGSLGGVGALSAALAAPERVAGLVLIGASAAWRDLGLALRVGRFVHPWVPRRRFHEHFARILVPGPRGAELSADGEALRHQMRHRTKAHVGGVIARLTAGGPYDLRGRLAELGMPVLVLHGELDRVIQERALKAFEAISDVRIVKLPGVRHLPQVSAPERCLEELTAFCAQIDEREQATT